MKRSFGSSQDLKIFDCPQCNKRRLKRPLNHVVSNDQKPYKDRNGNDVVLFTDICEFCHRKNYKSYFEPSKSDIRKVIKTMQEQATLEDQTLEDLL